MQDGDDVYDAGDDNGDDAGDDAGEDDNSAAAGDDDDDDEELGASAVTPKGRFRCMRGKNCAGTYMCIVQSLCCVESNQYPE